MNVPAGETDSSPRLQLPSVAEAQPRLIPGPAETSYMLSRKGILIR